MSLPWLSDPRRPLTSPREIPKLEAWFDALDTRTMLAGDGSTITDGGAVALWSDKSGNSGVNCLVLPGVNGNYASVPDAAALNPAGDFAGYVEIRPSDGTPAAQVELFNHSGLAGQRGIYFSYLTTGAANVVVSYDGTALLSFTTTATSIFADFEKKYLGFQVDVDDGAGGTTCTFYTSPDGVTWTPVEAAKTVAGTGALFDTNTIFSVGSTFLGTNPFSGNIYKMAWLSGTLAAGTPMLSIDFSTAGKKLANGDTLVCATGQTVTLNSSGATGARIAGERDLFQGTLANRPVYLNYAGTKYGYLNGTAGNYFSTPDSAAVSIGQRFALAIDLSRRDWTPSATQIFLAKRTAGQYTLLFYLRTDGKIDLGVSTDGNTTAVLFTSSAAVPDAANARYFIGAEVDLDNGSGSSASFYTSNDGGATWSELGATQTNVGTFTPFDGTAPLEAGSQQTGTVALAECNIYRAFITAGTLADAKTADFNPALYSSGTTFTASTGEVWTVQGGAHIVARTGLYFDGANDCHKTAAFSLSQPETVYGTLEQVTWTGDDYIYDGNGTNLMNLSQDAGTSSPTIEMYAGSGSIQNAGLALKTTATVSAVFNAASSSLGVNRTAPATGSIGTNNASGFTLAARGDGALRYSNIFVSEVAIYSAAHATATQDRWAFYAGRRHSFAA